MPLYVYKCQECGEKTEERQKFSDAPLKECPNCGAPEGLIRLIQNAGIVFKGSGFYINDSKGSKESLTGTAKPSSEPANGKSSDSKSETKADSTKSSD